MPLNSFPIDNNAYVVKNGAYVSSLGLPVTNGLAVHYDGDAIGDTYANGDIVTLWRDESGNNRDAKEVTAGTSPVYRANAQNGNGVVHFDETTWLQTDVFATAIASPTTHFTVWSLNDASTQSWSYSHDGLSGTGRQAVAHHGATTNNMYVYGDTTGPSYSISKPFVYQLTTGIFDGINSEIYSNGTYQASADPVEYALDGVTLAGRYNEPRTHGQIAEIIIYDRRLSDAERSDVESHLISKWGL